MTDEIIVALTTTKHTLMASEGLTDEWKTYNTPICAVDMIVPLGRNKQLKRICMNMAKKVHIDTEEKSVYIGVNRHQPNKGLVEYTEKSPHEFANDFFRQWEKIHTMIFEFVVMYEDKRVRFALTGLWQHDRWYGLQIKDKPLMNVLKDHIPGYGTFSTHPAKYGAIK